MKVYKRYIAHLLVNIALNLGMDFLREEVENLKKLGHSWEMEKYQIEEAIMKVIAGKIQSISHQIIKIYSMDDSPNKQFLRNSKN